jgi:hypothetical protein
MSAVIGLAPRVAYCLIGIESIEPGEMNVAVLSVVDTSPQRMTCYCLGKVKEIIVF